MSYAEGQVIFEAMLPGSTQERLIEFSEGTEDPNPIHIDQIFAKASGYPGVLQQGPMTTAHFARLLEQHVGAGALTLLDLFFTAPVFTDEPLHLSARVTEVGDEVTCALHCEKQDGTRTAHGTARFRP